MVVDILFQTENCVGEPWVLSYPGSRIESIDDANDFAIDTVRHHNRNCAREDHWRIVHVTLVPEIGIEKGQL